jgi:putative endonuclease
MTDRLQRHNTGRNKYTKHGIPWELVSVYKLSSRQEAVALEFLIQKNFSVNFKNIT